MFDLIAAIALTASAATVALGVVLTFGAGARERVVFGVALVAWLAAFVAAGATRVLYYEGGLGVPGLALAIVLPIAVLCGLAFGTRTGRARVAAASVPAMVAVQSLRVIGVLFVLLHAAGRLPAPFAPSAGWGDIAVGLLAVPVAWLAWRRPASSRAALLAWSAFGILDLALAVGLGATSSPGPVRLFMGEPSSAMMTTLPWILIPCFLVPVLMTLHLVLLARLGRDASIGGPTLRHPLPSTA